MEPHRTLKILMPRSCSRCFPVFRQLQTHSSLQGLRWNQWTLQMQLLSLFCSAPKKCNKNLPQTLYLQVVFAQHLTLSLRLRIWYSNNFKSTWTQLKFCWLISNISSNSRWWCICNLIRKCRLVSKLTQGLSSGSVQVVLRRFLQVRNFLFLVKNINPSLLGTTSTLHKSKQMLLRRWSRLVLRSTIQLIR